MIDVDPVHLEAIRDILKHYAPGCEVRAFGSRYKWTAKSHSDLDLVLIGKQKHTIKEMAALREAFEESILPFRVDVLDWYSISPEFQQVIEQGYEVIQKRGMVVTSSEWKRVKLKECARFQEGYVNPSQTVPEYFGNEIKWLRANDLNNSYVYDTSRRLSKKGFESAGKSALLFKPNSLAISKSGTIGRLGILQDYMCGNRAVINIEVDNTVCDSLFIFYSLLVRQKFIEDLGTGSVQKNLYVPVLAELEIDLPPLPIQRRIADILSVLDEKIELNRQTNATLEAIAQAIFKEWFVDFNFPGSAALTTGGATGEMAESELGMIPSGWRVATFEKELEAERGLSYKGDGLETGNATPMHNLNSVYEGGGYKFEGIKYYSGEYREKHLVKPGDLIIANTEQGHKYLLIGYPAIVPALFGEVGIYSHHIYRLRPLPHSYLTSDFLYYLLLQPPIREQVVGFANGTTVNMLKIDGLKRPKFILPPKDLISRFTELTSNSRIRQEENIKESQTLSDLRDLLLPKLMSGELDVWNG